ncbi:MAG: hypothetical protein NVSMB45_10290 [Ginsengibacter sp.]
MSLSGSFDASYFLKNSPSPLSIVDMDLIYIVYNNEINLLQRTVMPWGDTDNI